MLIIIFVHRLKLKEDMFLVQTAKHKTNFWIWWLIRGTNYKPKPKSSFIINKYE